MQPETKVRNWIVKKLTDYFGDEAYIKVKHQGRFTSNRGQPDLSGNIGMYAIYIEVKTEKGKLTKLQELEIEKINASGARAWVVYGKDEATIAEIIDYYDAEDFE